MANQAASRAPDIGLSIGVIVILALGTLAVALFKRRKWKRSKILREPEGNNLAINDAEAGRHRGVNREDTADPDLPKYQPYNFDQGDQLPKILKEINRLEGLPPTLENQSLLVALKNEAARLASSGISEANTPQVPPPTYDMHRSRNNP